MPRGRHLAPKTRTGRITWVSLGLALGLFLAMSIPAGAGSWEQKVTGGGEAMAGGVQFSLAVSASDRGGQIQYSRTDLSFHATVECLALFDEYAVVAGPVSNQTGDLGKPWVKVAILEGGVGEGDTVRVVGVAEDYDCENGETSFPGYVYDGNFTIREK